MEELQSTEILDREILEDARKKALRILKSADETIKNKKEQWEKKTQESLEELKNNFNKRKEASVSQLLSHLPIDKRRIKSQTIESLLKNAVIEWYSGLNNNYKIKFFQGQLKKYIIKYKDFLQKDFWVFYSGLSRSDTLEIVNYVFVDLKISSDTLISKPESDSIFASLIIENDTIRINLSIKQIVDNLLLEKRMELINALIGTEILNESSLDFKDKGL